MKRILILLAIILVPGLIISSAQKLQRLPLQKKKIELKSPASWAQSAKVDPRTKKEIPYDPMPRIEVADARAGKYNMKWIGYDGKEKVIVYQRPDCVDVVVTALTIISPPGTYEYKYNVQSLATSGDYLHGFAVQNFSSDILPKRPSRNNDVHIGNMSSGIFSKEGNWIRFAPLPPHPRVQPGQSIHFKLYSTSPPGLVMCRVHGGDFVMKGVGEEMPGELEASLDVLGYKAWPGGYTIGPVEKLRTATRDERISYLTTILPKCQEQGWITSQLLQTYTQLLKRTELQGVLKRAENDLRAGSITTEVSGILQGMRN